MLMEPQLAAELANTIPASTTDGDVSLADDVRAALQGVDAILAQRPRVVLLGEENAGKTALANALLGEALLPEAAVANTRTLTILHHAAAMNVAVIHAGERHRLDPDSRIETAIAAARHLEIGLPSPGLANFDIVDTPGISGQGELPEVRLRRIDIVIWCTRAGQAWKESERRAWQQLPRQLRHRSILALTNADRLHDCEDLERVRARVGAETAGLFSTIVSTGKPAPGVASPAAAATPADARFGTAALALAIANLIVARANRTQRTAQRLKARILRHQRPIAVPLAFVANQDLALIAADTARTSTDPVAERRGHHGQ